MRLLHAATGKFHEFDGAFVPAYAILSHRWEGDEVTYQEFIEGAPATRLKAGFRKLAQCCHQAQQDGLQFVWVDTCCIDKSSSGMYLSHQTVDAINQWASRIVRSHQLHVCMV